MNIIMSSRFSLVLSTPAGGLLLMATPVHAEQDSGSILASDPLRENTRRSVRDKNEATLTKQNQKRVKKSLKTKANIFKTQATDEPLLLSPPQNLRIITNPR